MSPRNPVTNELQLQRQTELEHEMRSIGTARFEKMIADARAGKRESETPYGSALLNQAVLPTAEAIKLAELGDIKASETPGVVAVVTSSDDPVQTFTKAAAVALPAMPNPDLVMRLTVA